MALTVPQPTLTQKGVTGNRLGAEKPIDLACGPVTFPDGTPLSPENATRFGFRLYRQDAGGTAAVWDEEAQSWRTGGVEPEPQSLFPKDGKWQSVLVAIGQKDQASQDKFRTNRLTGFPKYSVRCTFAGKDAQETEHEGVSLKSQAVEILAAGERDRCGLAIEPRDKDPSEATQICLYLKDSALTERGRIAARQVGGGFVIELLLDGASLQLASGGDIVLTPRAGQSVRVDGDLAVHGEIRVNGTLLHVP